MPELTAETVRTIVEEVVHGAVGGLRQELKQEINQLRQDTNDGFDRILTTVQAFQDEDQDTFAEIKGRLSYHNERIAKLERLSGLRK